MKHGNHKFIPSYERYGPAKYSAAWDCKICGVKVDHDFQLFSFKEQFYWAYCNDSDKGKWHDGKPPLSCEEIMMEEALL